MAMSPRKRARISRGVQYAILIVIGVVILLVSDWGLLQKQFANGEVLPKLFPELITVALKNTLIYTAGAFTFGLVLGLVLA